MSLPPREVLAFSRRHGTSYHILTFQRKHCTCKEGKAHSALLFQGILDSFHFFLRDKALLTTSISLRDKVSLDPPSLPSKQDIFGSLHPSSRDNASATSSLKWIRTSLAKSKSPILFRLIATSTL